MELPDPKKRSNILFFIRLGLLVNRIGSVPCHTIELLLSKFCYMSCFRFIDKFSLGFPKYVMTKFGVSECVCVTYLFSIESGQLNMSMRVNCVFKSQTLAPLNSTQKRLISLNCNARLISIESRLCYEYSSESKSKPKPYTHALTARTHTYSSGSD